MKCAANCSSQAPPTAPAIGCEGCSGNPVSQTAPSNVTGYCCCPGNGCPPIAAWFCDCCCSGGGSKPAVPSVEKKVRESVSGKVPWILSVQQWRGSDEIPTCYRANVQSLQTCLENILAGWGLCQNKIWISAHKPSQINNTREAAYVQAHFLLEWRNSPRGTGPGSKTWLNRLILSLYIIYLYTS